MAEALILDSEAINALARPKDRGVLSVRARAVARVAYERGAIVRVPAAVLAEVCRGPRFDGAINRLLNRNVVGVADLNRRIAERAGALLEKSGLDSASAVDAFVVATALEFESAVIATADSADIQRLSAPYDQVWLMAL